MKHLHRRQSFDGRMEPEIQYLKNREGNRARCAAASGSEPNLPKKRMSPAWAPTLPGSRTRNPLPGEKQIWLGEKQIEEQWRRQG